jgi:long-chain fatty acid transport protein
MSRMPGCLKAAVLVSGLSITALASATTGYFALGFGAKSMGLAGAVVSNPQDSLAAAANPAGMALVGERVDLGLRFFSPIREAQIDTSVVGAGSNYGAPFDVQDKSRRDLFLIPNVGFTRKLNDRMYWGISIYGNGGLNTTYDDNIYDQTAAVLGNPSGPGATPQGVGTGTPGTGRLGVDLSQVLIAPTIALKFNDTNTIGASLLIGIHRFSARGLGNFQCFTPTGFLNNGAGAPGTACAPGGAQAATPGFVPSTKLSGTGSDTTYGGGVRVGWIGAVTPELTLGAAFASKVYMTKFRKYEELFAEQGDLDIPANFSLGATVKASPKMKASLEFQRILYEGVNSISNPGPIYSPGVGPVPPPGSGLLGMENGLGFGWKDVDIYRLAVDYAYDARWTYRAGIAYNTQPIDQSQVLFNILAPATIQKHATLGFTFSPNQSSEWNFAYMHAFKQKVSTPQSAFGLPASINMYQNSVDLSYSLLF